MIKKTALIFFGLTLAITLLLFRPPFIKIPKLSTNDLYLDWLINGKDFFVPKGPFLVTNPELLELDNHPEESFTAQKQEGVYRIFCVGGSTTRGWPFHHHLSYPKVLGLYLKDILPHKNTEVINAGFHAFNSVNDITLFQELLEYEPDLVIVYEGINEEMFMPLYYGIRGRILYFHTVFLRAFPLYRSLNAFRDNAFDHAFKARRFVLSGTQVNQENLKRHYIRNMHTMSSIAKNAGCKIVFLTQLTLPAGKGGNPTIEMLNTNLKEFSSGNKRLLLDINEIYNNSNLGKDDPVMALANHPDYPGYMLMAREICKFLYRNDIISPREQWIWKKLGDDSSYFKKLDFNSIKLNDIYKECVSRMPGADKYRAKLERNVLFFKQAYE